MVLVMFIPSVRYMAAALVGLVAFVYLNLFWISWKSRHDSVFLTMSIHQQPQMTTMTSNKEKQQQQLQEEFVDEQELKRWKQFGLADDDDDDDDDDINNNNGEVSEDKEAVVVVDTEVVEAAGGVINSNYEPILFEYARPMAMLRQNISLNTVYKYPHTNRNFSSITITDGGCTNPNSTMSTCVRTFRRSHKMGCVMTKDLLKQYLPHYQIAAEPHQFTYHHHLEEGELPTTTTDYRDVLVLRNLYSAITSGYLYHYKGFECGMSFEKPNEFSYLRRWNEYISYNLNPQPRANHTLCRYLQNTGRNLENRIVSVRAYVDWVMRYYYSGILSHWALAQQIPEIRQRTLTVCYEDLMSEQSDQQTVQSIVDFFFNGTVHYKGRWDGVPPGHLQYDGEHSTLTDVGIRDMVLKLIKEVDTKYYNGEIAWANSILPCKRNDDTQ